jgi:drug/metabolite transporter superfamily protein YnfA
MEDKQKEQRMIYYNGRNLTPTLVSVLCVIIGCYLLYLAFGRERPDISAPEPAGYEINVFYASTGVEFHDTVKVFTRENGLFIVKNYACYRPFTNIPTRDSMEKEE